MTDTPFQQHSIGIAQRFLQTVVVVDDRASFTEIEEQVEKVEFDPLQAKPIADKRPESHYKEELQHSLNAKEMGDAFADRGLVCSILRPEFKAGETREKVIDRTMIVAHRADVLILDWQINGQDNKDDKGQTTRDIILRLLRKEDGRLRLIAIYTGDPNLPAIVDVVERHLQDNGLKPKRIGPDELTLQIDRARIEVYYKENVPTVTPDMQERRKNAAELPDALIASFSDMTRGLISNFAVDAISVVRENTYYLLSKLHKDLSGPYLVQRALTNSEDAFEFLVNLVGSELHSMLSEYITEDKLIEAVDLWLREDQEWAKRHAETKNKGFTTDELKALLLNRPVEGVDKKRDKSYKDIPQVFSGVDAQHLNAELAMLTTLRSRYGNQQHAPFLTLGTIVEELDSDERQSYLLCIQPRCDSVRLKDNTLFPFLLLEASSPDSTFHLVVKNGQQEIVYLKANTKPSMCRIIEFSPNSPDLGVVRAQRKNDVALWFPEVQGRRYRYLNELKEGYAQRVVNSFASEISRVGLNELEWLRRSAKR